MIHNNIRNFFSLLAAFLLFGIVCGCTRNNGNIGAIFGIWHLEELRIDGTDAPDYEHDCFWSFQNNIISFVMLDDPEDHTALRRWGTFEKEDGTLTLNLAHHGNGGNDYLYCPPEVLRLPAKEAVRLKIISEKGSEMVLSYMAENGEVITYILKKQ